MKDYTEKNRNNSIEKTIYEKVYFIKSIFNMIVIFLFLSTILYKLMSNTLIIELGNFNYSDLLSILLSLFAIGISIAFYFKASDTSNKFYDNTYKFTKDISETIGRMEERFGERLKHMDEGYTRFMNNGFSPSLDLENKEIEISKDKNELEEKLKEKEEIISQLMESNVLSKEEKQKFLTELNQRTQDVILLEEKINKLEKQYNYEKSFSEDDLLNIFYTEINDNLAETDFIKFSMYKSAERAVDDLIKRLPNSSLRNLRRAGFINNSGEATLLAYEAYKHLFKQNSVMKGREY